MLLLLLLLHGSLSNQTNPFITLVAAFSMPDNVVVAVVVIDIATELHYVVPSVRIGPLQSLFVVTVSSENRMS